MFLPALLHWKSVKLVHWQFVIPICLLKAQGLAHTFFNFQLLFVPKGQLALAARLR